MPRHYVHMDGDRSSAGWSVVASRLITMYGVGSISLFGLFFNAFSLYLFNKQACFKLTICLFKILAVFNSLYIVFFNAWYYSNRNHHVQYVFDLATSTLQETIIYVNLLIASSRYIPHSHPECVSRFLNRKCIVTCCLTALVYCSVAKVARQQVISSSGNTLTTYQSVAMVHTLMIVALPLLMMLILTVGLLLKVRSLQRISTVSSLRNVHTEPLFLDTSVYVTYVVISICSMVFLVYSLDVVLFIYYLINNNNVDADIRRIVISCNNFLHIFTASINFGIYCLFLLYFRRLVIIMVFNMFTGEYQSSSKFAVKTTLIQHY